MTDSHGELDLPPASPDVDAICEVFEAAWLFLSSDVLAKIFRDHPLLILIHLLANPRFELFPVHRWQLGKIGPQLDRIANVDVLDFGLRQIRVPMHQDANAARQ